MDMVHVIILQCDAKVQEETIIHNREELQSYIKDFTIKGYGGTDFRPVFERIEEFRNAGTLPNLRGLLYFTDGFGEYPKNMPSYKTAFVMLENQKEIPEVPSWAIQMKVSMHTKRPERSVSILQVFLSAEYYFLRRMEPKN